jgi:cytochrome c553
MARPKRGRLAIPATVLALFAAAMPVSAVEPIAVNAKLCATCHGRNGPPADPTVPVISGQQTAYIRKQLSDYRKGDRDSQIMPSIAQGLSQRQIDAIADYFGAAPWPQGPSTTPPSAPPAIAECKTCHNRDLKGATGPAGAAPRLAGQSSAYLLDMMTAFATGERANNPTMSALMQGLSPSDRKAIADYLAGLR